MTKKKGKYSQLISNTFLFALGNIGSKFIIFILLPLYTNELTAMEYGISELVITGTSLLIPIVTVSIQDATLRFTLDKKNNAGEVLKNTVLMLVIGSIVTCGLFPVIKQYKPIANWSFFFLIITVCYMVRNAFSIYLKVIGKTKLYALDSLLYTIFLMFTNIYFLTVLKKGLTGYFLAIIISTLLSIVLLLFFGDIFNSCLNNSVNKKLLKDMLIFSLPMVLNNISWWVINSSDKVMIVYFDSATASGVYSVASKIPLIITTMTNVFNQAWIISSVSEYDTTKDENFFSKTFSTFSCMLVLIASGIVIVIKPFMQIYVGSDFVESWRYIPMLLLGAIFQSYAAFFGAIYTSAKKNVSVMSTTLLAGGINIVLNIIFIPRIGIQGAVVATAIAYFTVFIFRMIDSQKYIKFKINYLSLIASIVILTCQCVLMVTVSRNYVYLLSFLCFIFLVILNIKTIKVLVLRVKLKLKQLLTQVSQEN